MQVKRIIPVLLIVFSVGACKKFERIKYNQTSTNDIIVPIGFTWETSRNIKINVKNTDSRFGNSIHQISLYDGDPAGSGKLMSTGSASNTSSFLSRIYLSYQISTIYILKTAPDNSTKTMKLNVGNGDLETSIGN